MGKSLSLLSLAALVLIVVPSAVSAGSVWSCGANGADKSSFYTNDTIYVCGFNITSGATPVNIYIVADTSTWTQNATLNDVSTGYHAFVTNSTGDLPPTATWVQPSVGSYDIVADVDRSGAYNSTDFVDGTSATGFSVVLQPWSTLLFEAGSHSPPAHSWNAANVTDNVMMQIKVTAYESEDIRLDALTLTASGSGDDKTGVSYVKLVKDADNDGVIDPTETLLGYTTFLKDDGVSLVSIDGGLSLVLGNSSYLIVAYVMPDTVTSSDTFKVQVTSASGTGISTGVSARINGLPLDSQTATVVGAATTTTTTQPEATTTVPSTTTTVRTTTTVQPSGETQSGWMDYLPIAAIGAAAAVCVAVAAYLLTRKNKPHQEYTYEDLEKKWRQQQSNLLAEYK